MDLLEAVNGVHHDSQYSKFRTKVHTEGNRHGRLLRPRYERPCRCAADKRNELASSLHAHPQGSGSVAVQSCHLEDCGVGYVKNLCRSPMSGLGRGCVETRSSQECAEWLSQLPSSDR